MMWIIWKVFPGGWIVTTGSLLQMGRGYGTLSQLSRPLICKATKLLLWRWISTEYASCLGKSSTLDGRIPDTIMLTGHCRRIHIETKSRWFLKSGPGPPALLPSDITASSNYILTLPCLFNAQTNIRLEHWQILLSMCLALSVQSWLNSKWRIECPYFYSRTSLLMITRLPIWKGATL